MSTITPFKPNEVVIPLGLTYSQVNLVLEGLGKLPMERVEGLYTGIRGQAVKSMQEAEAAHLQPTAVALSSDQPDPQA